VVPFVSELNGGGARGLSLSGKNAGGKKGETIQEGMPPNNQGEGGERYINGKN